MSSGEEQSGARRPFGEIEDLLKNDSRAGGQHQPSSAVNEAPAIDQSGQRQPAEPMAASASVATPHRRGFLTRLDPVFYLIIALAALGLVGSLYALISQNNAYFDREFQQLQQETAALNARLAANQAIIAEAESNPPVPPPTEQQTPTVEPTATVASAPAVEAENPPAAASGVTVDGTAGNIAAENGTDTSDDMPVAVIDAPPQTGISSDQLDSLKAEMQNLQSAVNSQEALIKQLIEQNQMLTAAATKAQREAKIETQRGAEVTTSSMPSTPAKSSGNTASQKTAPDMKSDEPPVGPEVIVNETYSAQPAGGDDSNQLVSQAYNAYQMQNYQRALSFYQRAVQFDPYHRDAILGIAASAQLLGDYELAEQHFRRLLSLEPQDTAAFSGLLNLPSNNGGITELELQQHARQHGSPAALFAILGNYLARNVRWSEAESAYATALKQDAGNADYLFNYAVVLDNLARHRESIHYYSRALEAASAGSFSFDRQSAEKRLESLTAGS